MIGWRRRSRSRKRPPTDVYNVVDPDMCVDDDQDGCGIFCCCCKFLFLFLFCDRNLHLPELADDQTTGDYNFAKFVDDDQAD